MTELEWQSIDTIPQGVAVRVETATGLERTTFIPLDWDLTKRLRRPHPLYCHAYTAAGKGRWWMRAVRWRPIVEGEP